MKRLNRPGAENAASAKTLDPIPDAIGDSIWLGGEAMIAPAYCEVSLPAMCKEREFDIDPGWLVI